jgi:hypothetical protein
MCDMAMVLSEVLVGDVANSYRLLYYRLTRV